MVLVQNPSTGDLCPQEHLAALAPNLMGKMKVVIASPFTMTDTMACPDSPIDLPSEVSTTLPSS